jgi:hypothetical protein
MSTVDKPARDFIRENLAEAAQMLNDSSVYSETLMFVNSKFEAFAKQLEEDGILLGWKSTSTDKLFDGSNQLTFEIGARLAYEPAPGFFLGKMGARKTSAPPMEILNARFLEVQRDFVMKYPGWRKYHKFSFGQKDEFLWVDKTGKKTELQQVGRRLWTLEYTENFNPTRSTT